MTDTFVEDVKKSISEQLAEFRNPVKSPLRSTFTLTSKTLYCAALKFPLTARAFDQIVKDIPVRVKSAYMNSECIARLSATLAETSSWILQWGLLPQMLEEGMVKVDNNTWHFAKIVNATFPGEYINLFEDDNLSDEILFLVD